MTFRHVRLIEWQAAALLVVGGLALAIPGPALTPTSFPAFLALMPEPMWSALFILAGCIRAGALIINGRSPRGSPLARALSAAFSAALLAGLAVGLALHSPSGGWLASHFVTLTAFEIFIVYRAVGELFGAIHAHHPA